MYDKIKPPCEEPLAQASTSQAATNENDLRKVNDPRKKQKSLFTSLMDKQQPTATMASKNLKAEMRAYEHFDFSPKDEKLILKHGPLLFYKMHEKDFPILSQLAKAVYCIMASSTPVETVFSGTKTTASPIRNRTQPMNLKNLTLLRMKNK